MAIDPTRFPPEVTDEFRAAARRPGALRSMVNYYRAVLRGGRSARAETFPTIHTPTLMIWGANDTALSRRMAQPSIDFCDDGRLVFLERDGLVGLETRANATTVMPTTHCVDAVVVGLCRLLEQCAGPAAVPAKVVLMRPREAPLESYREHLKCPIEFGGEHIAMLFDAEAAARPVLSGNAELAAEADRLSQRYLDEMSPDPTVERVRTLLLRAIPSGEFGQDGIARRLNQSTSTLQRRLRRAGTNYQDLLDVTRRDLALEYLKEGRCSLADIAFLLGFADQANFTRAFRRWTGRTPSSYLS